MHGQDIGSDPDDPITRLEADYPHGKSYNFALFPYPRVTNSYLLRSTLYPVFGLVPFYINDAHGAIGGLLLAKSS